MKFYSYLLLACWGVLGLIGCAQVEPPDSADAFIAGTFTEEHFEEAESTSLVFSARSGVYSLNLNSQHLTLVCDQLEADVSLNGRRIMCLPDSVSSPVLFHDMIAGPITSVNVWERTSLAKPTLSSNGQTLIIPTPLDLESPGRGISVLKVIDD